MFELHRQHLIFLLKLVTILTRKDLSKESNIDDK